ncbi:MAG TPA: putative metal-binding motif-containing protein, partial [Myxococcus sp.]|nr:putative metal-binding motif-containing protein [Myxococcus sp.]
EGAQGSGGTKFCAPATGPAGTVANATDCDDADRSARAGLAEVCDAVDNNCNGQVDEGISCAGSLARVMDGNLGGMGHDWRAVAVHPDGVPVWIAGLNGKLVVRKTAGGPFQGFSYAAGPPNDVPADANNCGNYDWYAAWVRPSDGSVFLAGEGGRVAQHTGSACINSHDLTGTGHATGIIGFESGATTTLYVVTDGGRLFTWVPGSAPAQQDDEGHVYSGIHALSSNLLLVGGSTSGAAQRVFAYSNGNLSAEATHTMSSTNVSGTVNSVWMGTSSLAYAVGNGGAVWRWNGTTGWTLVPAPTGVTANLFGVVTLPNGDAYLVDSSNNGRLHRRTPYGWATRGPTLPVTNKPLFGIAMRSAGDFWVVGDDGFVFHYPEPPRP